MLKSSVLSFNEKHQLFKQGDTLYLAVSGGLDSMAMLDFFYRIQEEWSLELIVLTVDHQLRGQTSRQDAEFVEAEAHKRNLRVIRGEVDVETYRQTHRVGTQEAARKLRYRFFEKQMNDRADVKLVTAHHADDQAETMLMQLAKGVPLKGIPLKGSLGNKQIIRPFLSVSKQELLTYIETNQVDYHEDPTNQDDTYTRNRFRQRILPFFKKENPNFLEGVQRLSEMYRDEDRILDDLANEKMQSIGQFCEQKVTFSIPQYLALPLSLQRRGFHLILNYLHIPMGKTDYFFDFLEWLQADQPNATYSFMKDFQWVKAYDQCEIGYKDVSDWSYFVSVAVDETVHLPNGWMLSVTEVDKVESTDTDHHVYLFACDKRHIVFPLTIRTRKPGDRIRLLGLAGTKKVKDIFIDEKVPKIDRDRWPIVENGDGTILWLPKLAKSDFASTGQEADSYVVIRATQPSEPFDGLNRNNE